MNFFEWMIALLLADEDQQAAAPPLPGSTVGPDSFDGEPDESEQAGLWGAIAAGDSGRKTATLSPGRSMSLISAIAGAGEDWTGEGVDLAIPTKGPYTNGKQKVSLYGSFEKIVKKARKIKYKDCRLSTLIRFGECHETADCHGPPFYNDGFVISDPEHCGDVNGIAKVEALYPFNKEIGKAVGGKYYVPSMGRKPTIKFGSETMAIADVVGYAEIDEGTFQLSSLKTGYYLISVELQAWPGKTQKNPDGSVSMMFPMAIGPDGFLSYKFVPARDWARQMVAVYADKDSKKLVWYFDVLKEGKPTVTKCYGL